MSCMSASRRALRRSTARFLPRMPSTSASTPGGDGQVDPLLEKARTERKCDIRRPIFVRVHSQVVAHLAVQDVRLLGVRGVRWIGHVLEDQAHALPRNGVVSCRAPDCVGAEVEVVEGWGGGCRQRANCRPRLCHRRFGHEKSKMPRAAKLPR